MSDVYAKIAIASVPVLLYKINGSLYFSKNHLERSLCLGTRGGVRLYVSGGLCWEPRSGAATVWRRPFVSLCCTDPGGGHHDHGRRDEILDRTLWQPEGAQETQCLGLCHVPDWPVWYYMVSRTGQPLAGVSLMTRTCWRKLRLTYSSLPIITSQQSYFLIFFRNWQNKVFPWRESRNLQLHEDKCFSKNGLWKIVQAVLAGIMTGTSKGTWQFHRELKTGNLNFKSRT